MASACSEPVAEHGIAGPEEDHHAGKRQEDEVEHDGTPATRTAYLQRSAINVPFARSRMRINAA